jgi:hypothetical protein
LKYGLINTKFSTSIDTPPNGLSGVYRYRLDHPYLKAIIGESLGSSSFALVDPCAKLPVFKERNEGIVTLMKQCKNFALGEVTVDIPKNIPGEKCISKREFINDIFNIKGIRYRNQSDGENLPSLNHVKAADIYVEGLELDRLNLAGLPAKKKRDENEPSRSHLTLFFKNDCLSQFNLTAPLRSNP